MNRNFYKKTLINFMLLLSFVTYTNATTINDSKGSFTINYTPKRIVVLELSFADALAIVGVKPIGIADDNDKTRLVPKLLEKIGKYTSIGTRSQPSLEIVASLKPDLIIADIKRHESVYEALKKIAPTVILPSKRTSYKQSLITARKIAKIIGKSKEMEKRLEKHKKFMKNMAKKLPKNIELQVAVARDDAFFLHTSDSYISEVIRSLGLKYAKNHKDNNAPRYASLEQLLAINPEYLIVGEYVKPSILEKWKKEPLWKVLKCAKKGHLIDVNPTLWARSRGILATEKIVKDLVINFGK